MIERDYARVMWWKDKTLGLMLINKHNQNFFIHAETLIGMMEQANTIKMVKRRDRHPGRSSSHHPGDVLGKATKGVQAVDLVFFFGEVERKIKVNRETEEITNLLEQQTYTLPADEFDILYQGIKIMVEQAEPYNALWATSRSQVPAFYFVEDKAEG